MADFCKQCGQTHFGGDTRELAEQCILEQNAEGIFFLGLCEGCTGYFFDHDGMCVDPNCDQAHGTLGGADPYGERIREYYERCLIMQKATGTEMTGEAEMIRSGEWLESKVLCRKCNSQTVKYRLMAEQPAFKGIITYICACGHRWDVNENGETISK